MEDCLACCPPSAKLALDRVNEQAKNKSTLITSHYLTTVNCFKKHATVIIHFHPTKVLQNLVNDTHYRNLFETNQSNGSNSRSSRERWEAEMFGESYNGVVASHRVKYGCLRKSSRGDPVASRTYGDSYLILKEELKPRCTFAISDSGGSNGRNLGTFEHCGHLVSTFKAATVKALTEGDELFADPTDTYKEVQIHGPVRLGHDIEALVMHESHKSSTVTVGLAEQFRDKFGVELIWQGEDVLVTTDDSV